MDNHRIQQQPLFSLLRTRSIYDYARAVIDALTGPSFEGGMRLPVLTAGEPPSAAIDELWRWARAQCVDFVAEGDIRPPFGARPATLAAWMIAACHRMSPALPPRPGPWRAGPQCCAALKDDPFAVAAAAHALMTGSSLELVSSPRQLLELPVDDDMALTVVIGPEYLTPSFAARLADWDRGAGCGALTGTSLSAVTQLIIKPYLQARQVRGLPLVVAPLALNGYLWENGPEVADPRLSTSAVLRQLASQSRSALLIAFDQQHQHVPSTSRLHRYRRSRALLLCPAGAACHLCASGIRLTTRHVRASVVVQPWCAGLALQQGHSAGGLLLPIELLSQWPQAVLASFRPFNLPADVILLVERLLSSGLPLGRVVQETNAILTNGRGEKPGLVLLGDPALQLYQRYPFPSVVGEGNLNTEFEIDLPGAAFGYLRFNAPTGSGPPDSAAPSAIYAVRTGEQAAEESIAIHWSQMTGKSSIRVHLLSRSAAVLSPVRLSITTAPPVPHAEVRRLAGCCARANTYGIVEKNVRQSGISVKAWRNAVQTFAAALDAAPLFVDGALQAHRAAADLSAMIAQLEAVVCQRGINRLRRTTSGGGLLPFDWPDPAAQGFVSKTEGEEACSVCGQPANVTTKCHRLLPIKRTVSCCASCGAASETPHWGRPLHIDAPTRALAGELVQVTVRAAAPDQQNCAGTIRIDLSGAAGSLWSAEPAMVRAVRAAGCDAGNQFGLTLSPRLISGLYLLRAWAIIDLDMFVAIRPFRIMASGQCPCDR